LILKVYNDLFIRAIGKINFKSKAKPAKTVGGPG